MHTIDSAGNNNGRFVPGDPLAGTPPTHFTADWSNAVQDEIANVVTDAGLELDKANNSQLLQAINHKNESLEAALIMQAAVQLSIMTRQFKDAIKTN